VRRNLFSANWARLMASTDGLLVFLMALSFTVVFVSWFVVLVQEGLAVPDSADAAELNKRYPRDR